MKTAHIDMVKAAQKEPLRIRLHRGRELRLRGWIAYALVRLASAVGVFRIEIVDPFPRGARRRMEAVSAGPKRGSSRENTSRVTAASGEH